MYLASYLHRCECQGPDSALSLDGVRYESPSTLTSFSSASETRTYYQHKATCYFGGQLVRRSLKTKGVSKWSLFLDAASFYRNVVMQGCGKLATANELGKNGLFSARNRLTPQDALVLATLEGRHDPLRALECLSAMDDPDSDEYLPSVMSSIDVAPQTTSKRPPLVDAWIAFAQRTARHPSDAVFVTHLALYFALIWPSAFLLWSHFTWRHALLHGAFCAWSAGPHTLLMHQHIHQRGVLAKRYAVIDHIFPYLLGPLLGHTWDSYRFHHKFMHHVEGNGPDDLSSTLRYQRDSVVDFLRYFGRFAFCCWYKMPLYFWRRGRKRLAIRALVQEVLSMLCIAAAVFYRPRAGLVLFLLPLLGMRFGMMLGNWGQHAFVDEDEPDHDLRSSITLIDVMSNRYCFNDGYHTAHHLNPLRHWRDQPRAMLAAKETYADGRALVFKDIDFFAISLRLFRHDYDHLARCLVPMNEEQRGTHDEVCAMLRRKVQCFSEESIEHKFRRRRL